MNWIDRHLWVVPFLSVLAGGLGGSYWVARGEWRVLGTLEPGQRSALYSSLTGTTSSLLGFALAAVAVLVAFPRSRDADIRKARAGVAQTLLATSLTLAISLLFCTVALVLDTSSDVPGRQWLELFTIVFLGSSLLGLLVSGAAFALAVLHQSQQ